jgi:hypothetical protein
MARPSRMLRIGGSTDLQTSMAFGSVHDPRCGRGGEIDAPTDRQPVKG